MKFLVIVLMALSLISCTKKSDSSPSQNTAPQAEVINQDLPDPSADLPAAKSAPLQVQSCKKDADCADKASCVNGLCATATAK